VTRKRLTSTVMLIGVVVVIAALAATAFAQGGRGGGPRDGQQRGGPEGGPRGGEGRGAGGQLGMMGQMLYPERTWTALCFQMETTDEQFDQLWALYSEVLEKRNDSIKAAIENRDMEAYRAASVEAKSTLETKLQEILTEEQWTQLETLIEAMGGMGRGGRPQPQGQD
jgi:hypothetical protein